jgi:hypothetical protein
MARKRKASSGTFTAKEQAFIAAQNETIESWYKQRITPLVALNAHEWKKAVAHQAVAIATHVQKYWPVDGKPIAVPESFTIGNADDTRRAAECLDAVERQRTGNHPGPVIEWQFRDLLAEMHAISMSVRLRKRAPLSERDVALCNEIFEITGVWFHFISFAVASCQHSRLT